MVRSNSLRPRLLLGSAVVALAAACSHGNQTQPTPAASPSASPVVLASAAAASPCAVPLGAAFEPDGATSAPFRGVQVVHFEDASGNLCAQANTPATPAAVSFNASVGAIAFAADFTSSVALLADPSGSGAYDQAQDVFGPVQSELVPSGAAYQLAVAPSPVPSASPTPTAIVIRNATSVSVINGISQSTNGGVALVAGPDASGLVALTSLANAPPQYGDSVPFGGSGYAIQPTQQSGASVVQLAPFPISGTATVEPALVRGPNDLVSFSVTAVASGFEFNAVAESTSLGSGTALRGSGALAFDPANTGIALVGRTTTTQNAITLVDGLPNAVNAVASTSLAGSTVVNSVAIDNSGTVGYVGTDAGVFVVSGIAGTTLTPVPPFAANPAAGQANALPYVDCNGASRLMTNVASVRLASVLVTGNTAATTYLVALGRSPATTCASGLDDAVVAVPIVPNTGLTPAPAPAVTPSAGATATAAATAPPASFTQNNVMAPPANADLLTVR